MHWKKAAMHFLGELINQLLSESFDNVQLLWKSKSELEYANGQFKLMECGKGQFDSAMVVGDFTSYYRMKECKNIVADSPEMIEGISRWNIHRSQNHLCGWLLVSL